MSGDRCSVLKLETIRVFFAQSLQILSIKVGVFYKIGLEMKVGKFESTGQETLSIFDLLFQILRQILKFIIYKIIIHAYLLTGPTASK